MTAPKRPKLFEGGEKDRSGGRKPVRIPGSCQVGDRAPEEVFVTDIRDRGCKVKLVSIGVTKAEPVLLRFEGEAAPITGRLKWVKQASVGVAFDAPIGEDTMERLIALIPDNVVPLRRARLG
jgi:hypothetical protein